MDWNRVGKIRRIVSLFLVFAIAFNPLIGHSYLVKGTSFVGVELGKGDGELIFLGQELSKEAVDLFWEGYNLGRKKV